METLLGGGTFYLLAQAPAGPERTGQRILRLSVKLPCFSPKHFIFSSVTPWWFTALRATCNPTKPYFLNTRLIRDRGLRSGQTRWLRKGCRQVETSDRRLTERSPRHRSSVTLATHSSDPTNRSQESTVQPRKVPPVCHNRWGKILCPREDHCHWAAPYGTG